MPTSNYIDLFVEAERALQRGATLADVLAAVRAVHLVRYDAEQVVDAEPADRDASTARAGALP